MFTKLHYHIKRVLFKIAAKQRLWLLLKNYQLKVVPHLEQYPDVIADNTLEDGVSVTKLYNRRGGILQCEVREPQLLSVQSFLESISGNNVLCEQDSDTQRVFDTNLNLLQEVKYLTADGRMYLASFYNFIRITPGVLDGIFKLAWANEKLRLMKEKGE